MSAWFPTTKARDLDLGDAAIAYFNGRPQRCTIVGRREQRSGSGVGYSVDPPLSKPKRYDPGALVHGAMPAEVFYDADWFERA